VPETNRSRLGRNGRSDKRQPFVAMVFTPLLLREGGACARRRVAMGGAGVISVEGVRGSSRGLR
jgi:hypothetical protein